jgi:hypothetical protein
MTRPAVRICPTVWEEPARTTDSPDGAQFAAS